MYKENNIGHYVIYDEDEENEISSCKCLGFLINFFKSIYYKFFIYFNI